MRRNIMLDALRLVLVSSMGLVCRRTPSSRLVGVSRGAPGKAKMMTIPRASQETLRQLDPADPGMLPIVV